MQGQPRRSTTDIPLRGIVVRQAMEGFVAEGVEAAGVEVSASAVLAADDAFKAKMHAWLGRPISLELLQELTSEIVLAYRRADRPLADAAVPEQNISHGTVQVIVLEAHLGRVSVEGARNFSAARIAAALRTPPGSPLVAGTFFADLDWLNKNPFRRVDLVYARGSDLGTTDVVLRVTEERPWRVVAGYDNSNLDSVGRDRWFAGVRTGNLWNAEHQLSLLYSQGRTADVYRAGALEYVVPFRWRHLLTFNAALAEPTVRGAAFDSVGRSWRAGLRYGGELARTTRWELDWRAAYETRSSNNDILFGGTQVFSGTYETHEFQAELVARRPGPAGDSVLRASFAVSPGDLSARNDSAHLSAAGRERVGARYAYADFGAERQFAFPRGFGLALAANARLTSDRLPPSSEFALGGASQLPGYSEASAIGDTAVYGQVKLLSPLVRVLHSYRPELMDALRFHAVYSQGRAWINDRTALEVSQGLREQRQLESVGVGCNYELSRRLQLGFTYGWQLRSPAAGVARASRGHVSASVNF